MLALLRPAIWSLALLAASCAASRYPDIDEPMPPGVLTSRDSPAPELADGEAGAAATGVLERAEVERVVDGGLGRFLSQVAVEPSLSAGKFTGWSIVSLEPKKAWQSIDLRPGDVVTRINGMAIEREVEAFDAFQAVRSAPRLEVSYLRHDQPRTLSYAIVGAPSPAIPRQAPQGGS